MAMQPFFDPGRFSPPQLDTPPALQDTRSFSFEAPWNGGSGGEANGRNSMAAPISINNHSTQQQQQHNTQQMISPKQESSYAPHSLSSQHTAFASPCSELGTAMQQLSFPNYQSEVKVQPRQAQQIFSPHSGAMMQQQQPHLPMQHHQPQQLPPPPPPAGTQPPPPQQTPSHLSPYHHHSSVGMEVDVCGVPSGGALPPSTASASSLLPHASSMPDASAAFFAATSNALPSQQRCLSQSAEAVRKKSSIATRKPSLMAQRSLLRSPRVSLSAAPGCSVPFTPYTPPPILSPLRSGPGLYCQINPTFPHSAAAASALFAIKQEAEAAAFSGAPRESALDGSNYMAADSHDPVHDKEGNRKRSSESGGSGGVEGDDRGACAEEMSNGALKIDLDDDSIAPRPQRKNGFFYTANDEMELETLRKDSWASTNSAKSTPCVSGDRKVSWMGREEAAARKASSVSDCYYDCLATPHHSDANPHINIGREYQARVKKWSDREVLQEEREAIEDRDEMVFDSSLIDHLSEQQLIAYEYLACSQAGPRPGRNKELALHLLMENKGNLSSAVVDLLRSDTLDWEQYPTIYNYIYNDVTQWTPEQIVSFQDALYKSEKDFHQVAQEIGLPVKVCVEWYYTWKKALPDDYRKLRNLRRKRRLLEQHMGDQQQMMGQTVRKSSRKDEEEDSEDSNLTEEMINGSASGVGMITSFATQSMFGVNGGGQHIAPTSMHTPSISASTNNGHSMHTSHDGRPRINSSYNAGTSGMHAGGSPIHKNSGAGTYPQSLSPSFISDLQKYHPMGGDSLRAVNKKGAQPAADGFFHCRLCDKCFEKVKSLNAHMKSHAMKARAEAEARAQVPGSVAAPSLLPPTAQLNVDAQLQQLGLASHLLGLNGMHNLTGMQPSPLQQASPHPLSGLHLGLQ